MRAEGALERRVHATPVFSAKSAQELETIGDSVLHDAKECVRV